MACRNPISIEGKMGPIQVACKQCLNCRIHRQSALTARCLLENATSFSAQFLTLTFAKEPEIADYSVFSQYFKRLHRKEQYHCGSRMIRYLCVGEYGSKTGRFHGHALVFNTPPELVASLTEQWPHGFVHIGTVTPGSIRYTARYTMKFETKGEEAMAGWSKKPPLGSLGIRSIARYMRDDPRNRYARSIPPQGPNTIQLQGRSYPLDPIMTREFMREFTSRHDWQKEPDALEAHWSYLNTMKNGDPLESARQRSMEKNRFWSTARFSNGTF